MKKEIINSFLSGCIGALVILVYIFFTTEKSEAKRSIEIHKTIDSAYKAGSNYNKEIDSLKKRCEFYEGAVNKVTERVSFLDSFYWYGSREIDSLIKRKPGVNTVNQKGGQAAFIINNL